MAAAFIFAPLVSCCHTMRLCVCDPIILACQGCAGRANMITCSSAQHIPTELNADARRTLPGEPEKYTAIQHPARFYSQRHTLLAHSLSPSVSPGAQHFASANLHSLRSAPAEIYTIKTPAYTSPSVHPCSQSRFNRGMGVLYWQLKLADFT